MGRKDPARVQAIRTELALMDDAVDDAIAIAGLISWDLDEESRQNRDETEIYNEASRICGQLEREGKIPADWWKERLQSQRNTILYQAVCDTWDARMVDDEIEEYNHRTPHDPDCKICVEIGDVDLDQEENWADDYYDYVALNPATQLPYASGEAS